MILPDVNVLLYANRSDSDVHDQYASWLQRVIRRGEQLLLADAALMGFLRLSTHPRMFAIPTPVSEAAAFVDALRSAPNARQVGSTQASWRVLTTLLEADPGLKGNLMPDAYLASLAVANGARLATRDRGFARFGKQLRWFDPADER